MSLWIRRFWYDLTASIRIGVAGLKNGFWIRPSLNSPGSRIILPPYQKGMPKKLSVKGYPLLSIIERILNWRYNNYQKETFKTVIHRQISNHFRVLLFWDSYLISLLASCWQSQGVTFKVKRSTTKKRINIVLIQLAYIPEEGLLWAKRKGKKMIRCFG
jgi:hypothetical protein